MSPLVPIPEHGRRYTFRRAVRLGDTDSQGRLRLDAMARYLQDVANDDAMDAGLEGAMAWVVRRVVFQIGRSPVLADKLELVTFCGGTGSRWAERRTSLLVDGEPVVEANALWVHFDPATGRPAPLGEQFMAIYGEASGGRSVSPRLSHPAPSPDAAARPWPQRATDLDVLGHANNAIALAAVEEVLAGRVPTAVEVEYRDPVDGDDEVTLLSTDTSLWLTAAGQVRVSAEFTTA